MRWSAAATDDCVFKIEGAKFNAKIAKKRLVPRENDCLAIAYDAQNEVWNFKNLTAGKRLKNYGWRAHLMIFEEAATEVLDGKTMEFFMAIPIIYAANYLSDFGYIILVFAVMIFLFLSLPLFCGDDKTLTDKANAYLALRQALKEANL